MTLPRHHEGKFGKYFDKAKTEPVISDYQDAYSLIVKNPARFRIEDAVAIHFFNRRIAEDIKKEEDLRGGKPFSDVEVNQHIAAWKKRDIEEIIITGAARILLEHRNLIIAEALERIVPKKRNILVSSLSGAWQNVLGNALGFIILIAAGLLLSAGPKSQEKVKIYYEQCVRSLLPPSNDN